MNKLLSIFLSTLLCASVIVFSPISQCHADNNNSSDKEHPVPTPFVDEGSDDDF